MTQMRKIIAQRMIESRRTSAHVHSMFEVDITRIVQLRNKTKSAFEQRHGARLTFMPFFVRAVDHRAAAVSDCQCLNRGRKYPLSPARQRGHCRRTRLGTHCSRAEECG